METPEIDLNMLFKSLYWINFNAKDRETAIPEMEILLAKHGLEEEGIKTTIEDLYDSLEMAEMNNATDLYKGAEEIFTNRS